MRNFDVILGNSDTRWKQMQSFVEKPNLLNKEDMPQWYQEGSYINTGYRPIMHSVRFCLRSLLYEHNETGSIYSHLLGFVFVASFMGYAISRLLNSGMPGISWKDALILWLDYGSSLVLLFNSSVFHTFCCHSESVNRNCLKADFNSVILMMTGKFVSTAFYAFYCMPEAQFVYFGLGIVVAIAIVTFNTMTMFQSPAYITAKAGLFFAFGSLAIVPVIHCIILYGVGISVRAMGLKYLGGFALSSVIGTAVFVFRIPERWSPCTFDYWGNSHQIMHVAILASIVFHCCAVFNAFEFWHLSNGTCEIPVSEMVLGPPTVWNPFV
ncbi:hemolysin-III related-domain-containing protein [Chytriomyces cf. hyalinus JEL632]|nr:hemolysin-III related-domain-containing protein [Chytriomyces cf. hyalinus JEL632]